MVWLESEQNTLLPLIVQRLRVHVQELFNSTEPYHIHASGSYYYYRAVLYSNLYWHFSRISYILSYDERGDLVIVLAVRNLKLRTHVLDIFNWLLFSPSGRRTLFSRYFSSCRSTAELLEACDKVASDLEFIVGFLQDVTFPLLHSQSNLLMHTLKGRIPIEFWGPNREVTRNTSIMATIPRNFTYDLNPLFFKVPWVCFLSICLGLLDRSESGTRWSGEAFPQVPSSTRRPGLAVHLSRHGSEPALRASRPGPRPARRWSMAPQLLVRLVSEQDRSLVPL